MYQPASRAAGDGRTFWVPVASAKISSACPWLAAICGLSVDRSSSICAMRDARRSRTQRDDEGCGHALQTGPSRELLSGWIPPHKSPPFLVVVALHQTNYPLLPWSANISHCGVPNKGFPPRTARYRSHARATHQGTLLQITCTYRCHIYPAMALTTNTESSTEHAVSLADLLVAIKSLHDDHQQLASTVESISGRVDVLAGVQQVSEAAPNKIPGNTTALDYVTGSLAEQKPDSSTTSAFPVAETAQGSRESAPTLAPKKSTATSRIILTTYPGQVGIDPVIMNWGHRDPSQRGPV